VSIDWWRGLAIAPAAPYLTPILCENRGASAAHPSLAEDRSFRTELPDTDTLECARGMVDSERGETTRALMLARVPKDLISSRLATALQSRLQLEGLL